MATHSRILAWKIPGGGAWRATVHGITELDMTEVMQQSMTGALQSLVRSTAQQSESRIYIYIYVYLPFFLDVLPIQVTAGHLVELPGYTVCSH